MPEKRRIMRDFTIEEISAVDRPAQAGAKVTLMKRADKAQNHKERKMDFTKMSDDELSKMDMEKMSDDDKKKWMAEKDKRAKMSAEKAAKKLEKAEKVIALKADERAHYDALDDAGRQSFLELGTEAQTEAVQKAAVAKADANPVIYKSLDGEEFRKNDDARMVAMAKRADEQAKIIAKQAEDAEKTAYAKRAEDELPNLGGDVPGRAALLKAIDGIEDDELRKSAGEALKSANIAAGDNFTSKGHSFGRTGAAGSVAKAATANEFEAAVQDVMKADGCSRSVAIAKVGRTNGNLAKQMQTPIERPQQ